MSKFIVSESPPLFGEVNISGSKNAILPELAACILTEEPCVLYSVPPLSDVYAMLDILKAIGAETVFKPKEEKVKIEMGDICNNEGDYELAGKLRGSFLIAGPLLARCRSVKLPLPGGCPIGHRPIDLHLKGFAALNADIKQAHGYIEISSKKLKGGKVYLDFPSVGATENILMAATLAEGVTVIENAAVEPEVCDLASFLISMGANIEGAGTEIIYVTGVKSLKGTKHKTIPDRIEAGTFMAAAAITGGEVLIKNVTYEHLYPVLAKLNEANVRYKQEEDGVSVYTKGRINAVNLKTMPFPGFPTDMQAPFMSMLSIAKGTSIITETVFENRFTQAAELKRMGADIKIEGQNAIITGVKKLTGAAVKATDLRAGAALILSALAAEGDTEIDDIYHIERGYYNIDEKLRKLGAKIKRSE